MNNLVLALSEVAISKSKMVNGKFQWPGGPAIKQDFDLPMPIIRYMALNPLSSKGYLKMASTCKYFFETNPILVAADLNGRKLCPHDDYPCEADFGGRCCVEIDMEILKSKIWIKNMIKIKDDDAVNYSLLCSKLYSCDYRKLYLSGTAINFNEFQFLVSSVEEIYLKDVKIIDADGKNVMLETILEAALKIQRFQYIFKNDVSVVSESTLKNIAQLKNLKDLLYFKLYLIPQTFIQDDLATFVKDHKNATFYLNFAINISEQNKERLDAIKSKIAESDKENRVLWYYE